MPYPCRGGVIPLVPPPPPPLPSLVTRFGDRRLQVREYTEVVGTTYQRRFLEMIYFVVLKMQPKS